MEWNQTDPASLLISIFIIVVYVVGTTASD